MLLLLLMMLLRSSSCMEILAIELLLIECGGVSAVELLLVEGGEFPTCRRLVVVVEVEGLLLIVGTLDKVRLGLTILVTTLSLERKASLAIPHCLMLICSSSRAKWLGRSLGKPRSGIELLPSDRLLSSRAEPTGCH